MSQSRSSSSTRSRRQITTPTELSGPLGSPARRRQLVNLLLGMQVGLIVVVVAPLGPTPWTPRPGLGLGLVALGAVVGGLGALGLGRDLRFSPVPPSGGRLHRTGIYAFIRHPMYLGLILGALGVTVATGRLLALLGLVGLTALLSVKGRLEDVILERKFGWEFTVYSVRVPAIVPQPWRSHRR